jgi:hypothetical protein
VHGTGSGSCPVANCDINGVEPSGYDTRELISKMDLKARVVRMEVDGTVSGSCPGFGISGSEPSGTTASFSHSPAGCASVPQAARRGTVDYTESGGMKRWFSYPIFVAVGYG